ncbi:MAG: hypothetical protein HC904_02360 [Blastochloris sp.]|nr:hypothetical protein [Blastochloris sp.]
MKKVCYFAWLTMALWLVAGEALAKEQALPPEEEYVRAEKGHLMVKGERLRVWGVIGKVFLTPDLKPEDSPSERAAKIAEARRGTDRLLDRFEELGFNGVRLREAVPNTGGLSKR